MPTNSTVNISRDFRLTVTTPQSQTVVKLTRLSAQVLASTLRAYSGLPSKGIDLNAHAFSTVVAEAVEAAAKSLPVVKLGTARRGTARTK